ncbi:MAG: nucleoside phosphorylase [Pseudomonadota bacterium]
MTIGNIPQEISEDRIPDLNRTIQQNEGIVRPIKRLKDPELGPDIILAMIQADRDYVLSLNREGAVTRHPMGSFELYQIKTDHGQKTAIAGPFIGSPHAVMGMEKAVALGAKRIWAFGWCGSIEPSLKIGDLLVPSCAFSEEGTSGHYPVGDRQPASAEALNRILGAALKKEGLDFREGPVWTTDAPYRETPEKVRAFVKRGALAVEMEMSALMTLATYRGVGMAGLLVVSDELSDLKWRPGFSSPERKKASREAGKLLLSICSNAF